MHLSLKKDGVKKDINELRMIKGKIHDVASDLDSVIDNHSLEVESYELVKKALQRDKNSIIGNSTAVNNMADSLEMILTLYENTENQIVNSRTKSSISPFLNNPAIDGFNLGLPITTLWNTGTEVWNNGVEVRKDNDYDWSLNEGESHKKINFLGQDVNITDKYHDSHFQDSV